MPMSQMPPMMSRATSRSPPVALRARFALTPLQPGLGLGLAVVRDVRRDRARCCRDAGRTRMQTLPFPLRIGELLVGERRESRLLRGVEHARPQRQREPLALLAPRRLAGIAFSSTADCTGWASPFSTRSIRLPMSTVIRMSAGDFAPFGGHPFRQTLLHEDAVDLDAGRLGERIDQRLDETRLASRVEVDLLG